MDIRDSRALKQAAEERLSGAIYSPNKLVLLHTAVSLGISLLMTLLNFLLEHSISDTGGLSGMQMRSVLETAQQAVQLVGSAALPFWQLGLVFCILRLGRTEKAVPTDLLEGFRRFGPALRLMLLRGILFAGIAMICSYISMAVFLVTPMASPVMDTLTELVESAEGMGLVLEETMLEQMTGQMMGVMYIFVPVFLIVAAPVFYRLRMADFVLMDQPRTGAMAAIVRSWKLTKRNCLSLLKLDVHFWWFYLAEGLLLLIGYLDLLLPMAGITLPVDETVLFWGLYMVYTLCRLALYWYCYARVQTTYAFVYDTLCQQQPVLPKEQKMPKKLPWDE